MRHTFLLVLALVACGCSRYGLWGESETTPSPDSVPTESVGSEPGEPPAPDLTTVVVKDSVSEFSLGDTIQVVFDRVSDYGLNVAVYSEDGASRGWARITTLGHTGPGSMVVTATALNLRSCPSTNCNVVGQVEDGDRVRVQKLVDGWYRLSAGDGTEQYAHAGYLMLPVAYQRMLVRETQVSTEEFYRKLRDLNMPGYGTVFTDWSVRLEGGVLRFRFYTPFMEGSPLLAVCEGMQVIADFVEMTMDGIPSEWINAYSAGAYVATPMNRTEFEVAGLNGNGAIFCRRPY